MNDMEIEHGVLARRLAGLQRRVDEQMRASAQRGQALEAEILRLRTQLVLARTCVLWGLNAVAATRPLTQRRARSEGPWPPLAQANGVICQTGCVGHAHPWLEADGLCRRTGQACERYVAGETHRAD
jgi:hypothetical protein